MMIYITGTYLIVYFDCTRATTHLALRYIYYIYINTLLPSNVALKQIPDCGHHFIRKLLSIVTDHSAHYKPSFQFQLDNELVHTVDSILAHEIMFFFLFGSILFHVWIGKEPRPHELQVRVFDCVFRDQHHMIYIRYVFDCVFRLHSRDYSFGTALYIIHV
jgi:hypothetical protein